MRSLDSHPKQQRKRKEELGEKEKKKKESVNACVAGRGGCVWLHFSVKRHSLRVTWPSVGFLSALCSQSRLVHCRRCCKNHNIVYSLWYVKDACKSIDKRSFLPCYPFNPTPITHVSASTDVSTFTVLPLSMVCFSTDAPFPCANPIKSREGDFQETSKRKLDFWKISFPPFSTSSKATSPKHRNMDHPVTGQWWFND